MRWGCCVSAFRETALHVLGGEAAASQALSASPPERLVLSFKGGSERPFGSSVASTALPAAGLVLKRRVFKSGREEWSVLGRLRQTHVFEGNGKQQAAFLPLRTRPRKEGFHSFHPLVPLLLS